MALETKDVWDLGEMFSRLMNFEVMSFEREYIEIEMKGIEEIVRKEGNLKEIAEKIKKFREVALPTIPTDNAGRITILSRIAELKGGLQERLESASVSFPFEP
ncbi:MAG: hypothetical protein KAW47_02630 [Thermoplasmatales archaeon]|nr:hypothetical protein [Thermoplasmatales archaeon]